MLGAAFSQVLSMSLAASLVIIAVLLIRLILARAPKVFSYALWAIVLFRLLCPFSIATELSLIPESVSAGDAVASWADDYVGSVDFHHEGSQRYEAAVGAGRKPIFDGEGYYVATKHDQLGEPGTVGSEWFPVLGGVWIAGMACMAGYAARSYLKLRKKLVGAAKTQNGAYLADGIASPFVVGILRPRIYLPSTVGEHEQEYIILHEQHHIRRFDHVTRALAFAALCIHWFNPLAWAAFVLSGKDMEMSCDEAVMRKMGAEVRADYSASLLGFATGRRLTAGAPLAFGEGDTRGRIENLARWKKPGALAVAAAVAVCAVAAMALATNPAGEDGPGLFPGYYRAEEIIYKNAKYAELDFLSEEDLPQVNLSAAGLLLLSDDGEWLNAGMMEETSLQKGNFDDYFYGVTYESSPGALRRWAKEAHLVVSVPTAYNSIAAVSKVEGLGGHGQLIYYAFATSDGSAYLACGSWDKEALSDPASDDSEFLWVVKLAKVEQVVEWFDHYRDGSAAWEETDSTIAAEEFPDAQFGRYPDSIHVTDGEGSSTLFTGAPIWNAFLTDLTGDGLPEICSTVGFEKGEDGDFVVIYDYANGCSYSLTDRGNYSYSLSRQGDKLVVDKRSVATGDTVEEGYLAYVDGTLAIVPGAVSSSLADPFEEAISAAILEHYDSGGNDGLIRVESHVILANEVASATPLAGQDDRETEATAYLLVFHQEYSTYGGELQAVGGSYVPTAITFDVDEAGRYSLKEYWEPRDGAGYTDDIRAKFPGAAAEEAFSGQHHIEELEQQNYAKALDQLKSAGSVDQRISGLLDEIASPAQGESDSPHELPIDRSAYDELVGYGEFTLRHCFALFLEGGQTDLRGEVMAAACQDIALSWGEAILMVDRDPPINGQDWFDEFKGNAEHLEEQMSAEELEKHHPASWLLLQMME